MSIIIDEVKPTTKPARPIFGDPVQVEEMLRADTLAVERKYQAAINEIEAEKVAIENRMAQHRRRYMEINEEISEQAPVLADLMTKQAALKSEQARLKEESVDSKNEVSSLEEEQGMLNDRMEYALDHLVPDDFVDPPYGAPLQAFTWPETWPDPPYGAPLTGDARAQRAYAGDDEDYDDTFDYDTFRHP